MTTFIIWTILVGCCLWWGAMLVWAWALCRAAANPMLNPATNLLWSANPTKPVAELKAQATVSEKNNGGHNKTGPRSATVPTLMVLNPKLLWVLAVVAFASVARSEDKTNAIFEPGSPHVFMVRAFVATNAVIQYTNNNVRCELAGGEFVTNWTTVSIETPVAPGNAQSVPIAVYFPRQLHQVGVVKSNMLATAFWNSRNIPVVLETKEILQLQRVVSEPVINNVVLP